MSAQKRLRRAFIATGLAVFTLTASFNAVATPVTAQPAQQVTSPAPAQISTQRATANMAMLTVFRDAEKIITDNSKDPTYVPANDPVLNQSVNRLKTLMASGADANLFEGTGINLLGASNMTAFHAAIVLAAEMQRPDLIEAFLANGADPKMKAPDQWSAMDYAISALIGAQGVSRSQINASIQIIQTLNRAGATLADAGEMHKLSQGKLKTYADTARNLPGLLALYHSGLVTLAEYNLAMHGKPGLTQTIQNTTSITADLLRANGGDLLDYPEALPGGPEPYKVLAGDTLHTIAARFAHTMGTVSTNDAARMIAEQNDIKLNRRGEPRQPLTVGAKILIPLPIDVEMGYVNPPAGATLVDAAKYFQRIFYKPGLTPEQIAAEIATLNGLDPAKIGEVLALKPDQGLMIPFANDSHNQLARLVPPVNATNREVDLVVIEPADDHGRNTYRVATGTAYSINPHVDLSQFHSLSEMLPDFPGTGMSDAVRMLLSAENSAVRDRIVFSHSMAFKADEPVLDRMRNGNGPDNPSYENIRLFLDRMDRAKPTIFSAAGNFWPKEGRYIQSQQALHSPHAVLIGAAGRYPVNVLGQKGGVMAPYSTHGADVCAPLPQFLKNQMEGTSFSTPLTAALYRQMAEWYGDRLSFEEIMAAALMTADRNVLDYVDVPGLGRSPLMAPDKFATKPAEFRTNGGGLPNHERCGAGVINVERWQQALNTLLTLKDRPGMDAEGSTVTVHAGQPVLVSPTKADGRTEYVYNVVVPSNMTLGKLTFMLPQYQGRHSEIVVRTPGGFEKHMPKSISDVISTFAFAYEDVKAGDVIEIRTTAPLAPSAGIMLRGHAPGNAIALLRHHLQANGILPEAAKMMEGDKVVGPITPVTVLQDKAPAPKAEGNVPTSIVPDMPQRPIIPPSIPRP
jgi:hypothetical protein